jgi:hypothetical protein
MFTKNQIALQTFIANGFVTARNMSFAQSIATAQRASVKQLFHVDKMVNEILSAKPAAPLSWDASKIFAMFDSAKNHKIKYPKINLKTADGRPLRLNMSRNHPGKIFLGSGGFGTDTYGYLPTTGEIYWYNKDVTVQADVEATVKHLATDPVLVAAAYGKLNHNCCFCSKGLDTPESLAVGFGPICAKHYNLSWGKNVVATKPNLKELLAEVGVTVNNAAQALDTEFSELMSDVMT